tara:strand:+ start:137 stop:478 length:342 start_codon:yes stop_codon:yes gene_type:complete
MHIPKSIKVAGVPVKILREDLSDDDNFGYYSHERRVIVVDKSLSPSVTRSTIRHEMIHAALAFSGLSSLENYEEEAIVRCMDEIFFPAWESFLRRFKARGKPRNLNRTNGSTL